MSVDEKDDIAWNLVALAFSIAGSFFTASGLISMKLANIAAENNKNINVYYHCNFLFGLLCLSIS